MDIRTYWAGRKLYARAMDLAEEENKIEIKNTKNAERFCQELESILDDFELKVENKYKNI